MIKLFAERTVKCEVKPDEDVKAFTSIAVVKMSGILFKYDHFPKPEML